MRVKDAPYMGFTAKGYAGIVDIMSSTLAEWNANRAWQETVAAAG